MDVCVCLSSTSLTLRYVCVHVCSSALKYLEYVCVFIFQGKADNVDLPRPAPYVLTQQIEYVFIGYS